MNCIQLIYPSSFYALFTSISKIAITICLSLSRFQNVPEFLSALTSYFHTRSLVLKLRPDMTLFWRRGTGYLGGAFLFFLVWQLIVLRDRRKFFLSGWRGVFSILLRLFRFHSKASYYARSVPQLSYSFPSYLSNSPTHSY